MYPVQYSLYVGDLDSSVHENDVNRAFARFPGLVSAKLCRDRISGRSLCYAYVNYYTVDQAMIAMRAMNHMELKGKPMRIMWVKRDPYARKTGVGNLYVKNLELLVRASDLERVFSEYGSVLSCKVVYDECSGKSRQFGFVQMSSDETAQKAISALHGSNSTCLSKSLYVAKFVKKCREKKNLYIKNLEESITTEALKKKFSKFGQVANAVVMRDEHGNSKGFGFVSFEQSLDAQSALSEMNASIWGSKVVYVGFAQKKAEREVHLKRRIAEKEEEIRSGRRKGYGVYVANLDESVSAEELTQLFESCGHVIFAKVVVGPSRRSRGFGFVYLSSPKGAQCALSMDGMSILKSRPIIVKRAFSKRGGNKYTAARTSTISCSDAVQYLPLTLTSMNDMYNLQYIDQNPSYTVTVPFHNYAYTTYSPQPPPVSYFDPTMQYIPASGWNMGYTTPLMDALNSTSTPVMNAYTNYALGSTPVMNACTNSGKRVEPVKNACTNSGKRVEPVKNACTNSGKRVEPVKNACTNSGKRAARVNSTRLQNQT